MNNDQQPGWTFHHQGTQAQIRENFDLQRFLAHIGAVLGPVLLTMICVPASRNGGKSDVAK